jgi:hypothetical protein
VILELGVVLMAPPHSSLSPLNSRYKMFVSALAGPPCIDSSVFFLKFIVTGRKQQTSFHHISLDITF